MLLYARVTLALVTTHLFSHASIAFAFGLPKPVPEIPTKVPTPQEVASDIRGAAENLKEDLLALRRVVTAPDASVELWGIAGKVAYRAAAQVMAKRSPTGKPLSRFHKDKLRESYGDLVDKVTIHWGTPTLDEWAAEKFSIELEDADTEGQTYGYDIYIRWKEGEQTDTDALDLLSHELMHSVQYERLDRSLERFGYEYFKDYKEAGFDYDRIAMEVEAYEQSPKFLIRVERWLDGGSDGKTVKLVDRQTHGTLWKVERQGGFTYLRSWNNRFRGDDARWLDGGSNGETVKLVNAKTHGTRWRLYDDHGYTYLRSQNQNYLSDDNPRWLDGASDRITVKLVDGTSHGTRWKLIRGPHGCFYLRCMNANYQ